ncbi:MAG: hypothetical protein ACO2ZP_10985, partial [Bacteriovoracaceae bacterium]
MKAKKIIFSFFTMCAGAFLVLGGLVLINTAGTNKNEGKTTKVVNFDLKKIVQKKVTRKRKEKRKKRRKKSKSIPTAPKISSLMSGNSFGVAGLEFNNDPIDGSLLGVKGDQVMDEASVDTQALTGEFEPVSVSHGDEILAGSVNGSSVIEARILRIGKNAFLGRLEHLAR